MKNFNSDLPKSRTAIEQKSELVSKCRHVNKHLLSNYKAND